jgi:cytidylate kinase
MISSAGEQPTSPVVTIDGPVGSGKGTIASRLAQRLGWHFLDSGALYRLVALKVLGAGDCVPEDEALAEFARHLDCQFTAVAEVQKVFLDGQDVTLALRREAVSAMASRVAAVPAVRLALVQRQRDFRQPPGLIADGRDMGTVIFPDALVKLFLTASTEARAERRYKQLKEKGESVNLSRLFRDLEARDARDTNRAVAPLVPAQDAIIIDSTDLDINEVVEKSYNIIKERALIG